MAASLANNLPARPAQLMLYVPFLTSDSQPATIKFISQALDTLPRQTIAAQPWPEFAYKPKVSFSIAHDAANIYLKYYVTEAFVRACYHKTNDPVYKDSCVEFFIAFQDESGYYNLEFNVLGTCRAGFGPDRENRILLPPEQIDLIRREVVLTSFASGKAAKEYQWQLTLVIPVLVFRQHFISSLRGMKVRGNFFKCGDELPQPHFLVWNDIVAPQPNFHLPAYFGHLQFG